MSDLMKIVLVLSASGTALAAALAVLRRVLKNKLPQALFYYLWLLVLLRLVVPAALPVPGLELTLPEPAPVESVITTPHVVESSPSDAYWEAIPFQPSYVQTFPADTVITGSGLELSFQQEQTPWYGQVWDFLCDHFVPIWLAGAAVHFLWFAGSYLQFCRSLKKNCAPLWEHEQAFLNDLRGRQPVEACRSPLAGTPMLVGLVRHRIVLPDTPITTLELEYILRHELTHLRRRDLLFKWVAVAVTSFHWFNPLMPWLRREISRCCELSCDEAVIGGLNDHQKQQYGETLLALAALHALPRAVPATTLCEEKKQLRERLVSIMKHKKATVVILLLSALLALLIAGCAAVLGPTLKPDAVTGPLTEEQQAPVLEDIRAWAADNVEAQGELTLTYSHDPDNAYGVGMLSTLGDATYLYDLHTGDIRPVDGTYPDTADLGYVQLAVRDGDTVRDYRIFHVTNGDPAKAASPFLALEQLADDYPEGRVTQLQWQRRGGQYLYIRVDFVSEGAGYCFEFTSINGLSKVRDDQNATQREQGMTLPTLVQSLKAVTAWQETESSDHDRENYHLSMLRPSWLSSMMSYGDFAEFENMVVYDLATGETAVSEKPYTGSAEYGAFTLLYPAEDAQRWVYIVDDSGDHSLRAGALAVVTEDTPLENAYAWTVDAEGREVLMDLAMTVEKGTLVYIDSVEGANCEVTVLMGEPPRVQGTLNARLLATALTQANQVILKDTKTYDDAGGTVTGARSGVAQIEQQTPAWLQVSLPGGEDPFWVRRVDLVWEWPIVVETAPENMTGGELKSHYMDFAMDWRVDFIPDFDWNSYSGTVSTQDFLMLTYYIHRDSLPEDGSMSADLVEMVMETQFGIESVQHESLFKTWNWDAGKQKYLPVPQGVAEEGLFDVTAFGSAVRWEDGAEQTVYTLTLREYGYPFVFGTEQYDDLAAYAADESAHYRENVAFLLKNKGELLKKGEISAYDAIRQLILEGNTSGFTKGTEIRLEYYMTGNGPRFLYKSEREFDFTPGDVYENEAMGFRLTFPASWTGKYRLVEFEDTVRIDDAWGGTLCSVFRQEAAGFAEEHIPVPYRVLGQNSQYVWLMYFASDVQYDPGNAEQTTAYLGMYQDLQEVPFEILSGTAQSGLYDKTAAWLAQEFHRVYDPYYDIQELIISNWQESGNQATFHYKMTWLNYNRDPDTVPYIMEAKAKSQSSYETLYKDYLALKKANYIFKIVWKGDTPTLYSDVSVKGAPEWELTQVDDYVLSWNDPEDSRKVFGEILWNALLKGELPNGSKLDWRSVEAAAENEFAVLDIDGDGREELLLSWTNAIMAGHELVVYGCWRGAVYTQLSEFPSLRFYDNGAVEVEWSHNQGGSGAIWPYDAYRYDTESDTYQFIGAAEAWNKSVRKEGFPDDIDADGDGVVYYLLPADWEGQYSNGEIVDGAEYLEWRESWLGEGKEITVTFQKLTEENIAKLGAPKPEVVTPEPVG